MYSSPSPEQTASNSVAGRWAKLCGAPLRSSTAVVQKQESTRGPHLRAPRAIFSLWAADPEATRVLMRRFYALWNGKVSLPACTALKLAQDFVRSKPAWRHPYYWAGWQLWASFPRKGGS